MRTRLPKSAGKVPGTTRRPKNPAEAAAFDQLVAAGWNVTKRGWPDFFAWRGDETVTVEVKRRPGHVLKTHQILVLAAFRKVGIRTLRFDPVSGFTDLREKG